jgi:cobyric acid synthase
MKILQILSTTAAAGKTVWAVGLLRALRESGLKPAAFKAVSEDSVGFEVPEGRVSLAALHLMSAAGREPSGFTNPVLTIPTHNNRSEVWLLGRYVGEVSRLGRDMPLLSDLSPEIQDEISQTTFECLRKVAEESDVVIAEGSGGATDLSLMGLWDIANIDVSRHATAIVIVARASQGGAIACVRGTVSLLGRQFEQNLRGFAFNDVRCLGSEFNQTGKCAGSEFNLTYLGATPWLSFFDGREQYAPYTTESEEDHQVLGQAFRESVSLSNILEWLDLGSGKELTDVL